MLLLHLLATELLHRLTTLCGCELHLGETQSSSSVFLLVCRESSSSVKLFKNFKESNAIKTNFAAEALSGGSLLGIRGSDFVCFYDWASGKVCLHS